MKEYHCLIVYTEVSDRNTEIEKLKAQRLAKCYKYDIKDQKLTITDLDGNKYVHYFFKYYENKNPYDYLGGARFYCVRYLNGNYKSDFINCAMSRVIGGVYDITTDD